MMKKSMLLISAVLVVGAVAVTSMAPKATMTALKASVLKRILTELFGDSTTTQTKPDSVKNSTQSAANTIQQNDRHSHTQRIADRKHTNGNERDTPSKQHNVDRHASTTDANNETIRSTHQPRRKQAKAITQAHNRSRSNKQDTQQHKNDEIEITDHKRARNNNPRSNGKLKDDVRLNKTIQKPAAVEHIQDDSDDTLRAQRRSRNQHPQTVKKISAKNINNQSASTPEASNQAAPRALIAEFAAYPSSLLPSFNLNATGSTDFSMAFEHSFPFLPNARFERFGSSSTHQDYTLYYKFLDDVPWLTLDAGVSLRQSSGLPSISDHKTSISNQEKQAAVIRNHEIKLRRQLFAVFYDEQYIAPGLSMPESVLERRRRSALREVKGRYFNHDG